MLNTQVAFWVNEENKRHNRVVEEQNAQDIQRKIKDTDDIIKYRAQEVAHWKKQLAELTRHNKATESAAYKQAKAALQQAQAALSNAQTNRANLKNLEKQAQAALISAGAMAQQAQIASEMMPYQQSKYTAETLDLKSAAQLKSSQALLAEAQAANMGLRNRHFGVTEIAIPLITGAMRLIPMM